jgi:tellurite resistance protein
MSDRYLGQTHAGKVHNPSACEHDPIYALLIAGAFVAVADGSVDLAEREEAVRYIDQAIKPKISKARIAGLFEQCARLLQDRDCADVVLEALRTVPALSLTSAVIEIADRVAAADGVVHSNEAQAIRVMRLIMLPVPEPQVINQRLS